MFCIIVSSCVEFVESDRVAASVNESWYYDFNPEGMIAN